jgi:hypothetical protein
VAGAIQQLFDKAGGVNAAPEVGIEYYEVPTNMEGILKALNQFAYHPDNGR